MKTEVWESCFHVSKVLFFALCALGIIVVLWYFLYKIRRFREYSAAIKEAFTERLRYMKKE